MSSPPDAFEIHEIHEYAPGPLNIYGESPNQPAPEVAVQDLRLERAPEINTSSPASEDSDDHYTSNDNDDGLGAIADLCRDKHLFCMVEECRYWHTNSKQIKRHRDRHFYDRGFGYLCPNQTDTCPRPGHRFSRSDAVNVHCKKFKKCGEILKAKNRVVQHLGTPAMTKDLRPYDPNFHIPYKKYDGRNQRSGRKSQN